MCLLTSHFSDAKPNKEKPIELNAEGVKAAAEFENKLQVLRKNLQKKLSIVDPSKKTAFIALKPEAKGRGQYNKGAAKKMMAAAEPILKELDPALSSDKIDTDLMRTAIIAKATPRGLAAFVQQGAEQRKMIDDLLKDPEMMKRMLVSGGAKDGRYGKALEILREIRKQAGSPLTGVMERLAIAVSLEFAAPDKNGLADVDPIARFNYYQDAHKAKELERHFDQHSIYLLRQVVNDPHSNEEMLWMRKMLQNYRPDFINYPENYQHPIVGLMYSEFGHKRPEWDENAKTTRLQQAIDCGGQCGPKGDFGRCLGRAYGLPVWGARLRSHTAMTNWTANGWNQILGVSFKNGFWNKDAADSMTGYYFHAHMMAREVPEEFMKACRLKWYSAVFDEEPINGLKPDSSGGFFNSLSYIHCKLTALRNDKSKEKKDDPWMHTAFAKDAPKFPEFMVKPSIPASEREANVLADGSIIIPAVATISHETNTDKVILMKSFDEGMQLHYKRWKLPEPVVYEVEVPKAGKYKLSMQVCTVNKQQFFMVNASGSSEAKRLELPYTLGDWENSKPIELTLKKGINTIELNRTVPKEIASPEEFEKNSYKFSGPEFGGISIKSLKLVPTS